MTYRPEPVTQRDSHPLANSNCMSAAAAVGIRYEVLGGRTGDGTESSSISSGDMRDVSGDTSGGQNSDEIDRSWRAFGEDPTIRDGRPWGDVIADLEAGRGVMLQVWHATVGGVCLSGSGAYGHGIYVNPESRDGDNGREWIVADPWCKPPKWGWIRESKLRAGAEEWYSRCTREAGGGELTLERIRAAAIALMTRYRPGRPAPADEPPSAGGGGGVLFVSTAPRGGHDVAINTNGSRLWSGRVKRLSAGQDFYADGGLHERLGEVSSERTVPFLGPALGPDSAGHAVILNTSKPYDDGEARPTIVYVNNEYGGEPTENPDPMCPPVPPSDDCAAQVAARDAEWRAWLTAGPEPVTGLVGDAEAVLAWAAMAPDAVASSSTDVSSVGATPPVPPDPGAPGAGGGKRASRRARGAQGTGPR